MEPLTAAQRDAVEDLAQHFAHRVKSDVEQERISNVALQLGTQLGTDRFQEVLIEALRQQITGIAGRCIGPTFLQATGGKTGIRGDQAKVINALSKRLFRELVMPELLDHVAALIPGSDFLESLIYTDHAKTVAKRRGLIQIEEARADDGRRLRRIRDLNIDIDQLDAPSASDDDDNNDDDQDDDEAEAVDIDLVDEAPASEIDLVDDDEEPMSFSNEESISEPELPPAPKKPAHRLVRRQTATRRRLSDDEAVAEAPAPAVKRGKY